MDLADTDEHLWRAVVRGDGAFAAPFAEAWRRRARVRIVDESVLPWLLATTN